MEAGAPTIFRDEEQEVKIIAKKVIGYKKKYLILPAVYSATNIALQCVPTVEYIVIFNLIYPG
jgi:hypothetical protein